MFKVYLNYNFTPFSSVSIVKLEQVNADWAFCYIEMKSEIVSSCYKTLTVNSEIVSTLFYTITAKEESLASGCFLFLQFSEINS